MFLIQCKDGTTITGAEMTWDDARQRIGDHGGIAQLALTDGVSLVDKIEGADGYIYFAQAKGVLRTEVQFGNDGKSQMSTKPMPPNVIMEEIAGFFTPETARIHFDSQIRGLKLQLDEVMRRHDAVLSNLQLNQETRNMELVKYRTMRDRLRDQIDRLSLEQKNVNEDGGMIISRRMLIQTERYPLKKAKNVRSGIMSEVRAACFVSNNLEDWQPKAIDAILKLNEIKSIALDQKPSGWYGACPHNR